MRPPGFWYTTPETLDWRARLLVPVGALLARITTRRVQKSGYRAAVPVICIGNISLGGTGKTPTVMALLEHLRNAGIAAHVVSRGYGGSDAGPLRVDAAQDDAGKVGDEPLMLASFGAVWVSRHRALGVRCAEREGAEVILLDDGLQNPSVEKSVSIVVVDAEVGFGNGRVIPAGPLREPVASGLSRADLLLSVGSEASHGQFMENWGDAFSVPVVRGELHPLRTGIEWSGQRVFAFAGIGRPEKFFATLRRLDAHLVRTVALDDHQPLTGPLLNRLQSDASALDAQLVTTEKDAVRLPVSYRQNVLTLPVRLEIEDWTLIDNAMARVGLRRPRR